MKKRIVGLLARFLRGKTEEERNVHAAFVSLLTALVLVGLLFVLFTFLPEEIAIGAINYAALLGSIATLAFLLYQFVFWPWIQRIVSEEEN